ncbi:hypothetical protein LTR95_012044 [Oleoguttula sp. CCFEE 5521]
MSSSRKFSSDEVAALVELSAQQMELLTTLMGVAHEKHALETENAKFKRQLDVLKDMLHSKHSIGDILVDYIMGSLPEAMTAHVLFWTQAATQQSIGMTSNFDDEGEWPSFLLLPSRPYFEKIVFTIGVKG